MNRLQGLEQKQRRLISMQHPCVCTQHVQLLINTTACPQCVVLMLLLGLRVVSVCLSSQSYPEFCRSTFDTASQQVREAVVQMEQRYGKVRGVEEADGQWKHLHLPAPQKL